MRHRPAAIVGVSLEHDPRQIVMVLTHRLRVSGLVAAEVGQQGIAEEVGHRLAGRGALDHTQQGTVGGVDASAPARPGAILRIGGRERGAVQRVPRLVHLVDHGDFVAILQIASDTGQRHARANAVVREQVGIADAGQHQQLRRVERPARENDLAPRRRDPGFRPGGARIGVCRVQALAFLIFDADRAVAIVEQDPRRERVQLDPEQIGILLRHAQQPLARPDALIVVRRQRRVAGAGFVALDDAPVVRIEQRFEAGYRGRPEFLHRVVHRFGDDSPDLAIDDHKAGLGLFGRQPPRPPVAARVDAERLPEPLEGAVPAVLDALEILPHRRRSPRGIARQIGELIPVRVARIHENHRVVRRAAAERAGARIPDAVLIRNEFRIPRLPGGVAVVANEEIPAHRRVLGRERVKCRNVVRGSLWRAGIAAGFEDEHRVAGFGEPGGHRPAAGAGAHHDVVGLAAALLLGQDPRPGRSGEDRRLEKVAAIHSRNTRTSSGRQ